MTALCIAPFALWLPLLLACLAAQRFGAPQMVRARLIDAWLLDTVLCIPAGWALAVMP